MQAQPGEKVPQHCFRNLAVYSSSYSFLACRWHSVRKHEPSCTQRLFHRTSIAAGAAWDPWACSGGSRGVSAAGQVSRVHAWVASLGIPGQRGVKVPRPPPVVPCQQGTEIWSLLRLVNRYFGSVFTSSGSRHCSCSSAADLLCTCGAFHRKIRFDV